MCTWYNKMVNEEDDERKDSDSESVNQIMEEMIFIPNEKEREKEKMIILQIIVLLIGMCTWYELVEEEDYETTDSDSASDTESIEETITIRNQKQREEKKTIIWGILVVLIGICTWYLLIEEEDYETTDSDSASDTESIEETITINDQKKRKHSATSAGQSRNCSIHTQKKRKESATSAVQPKKSSNHAQKERKQSANSAAQSQNSSNQAQKKGKQFATSSMESQNSEAQTDDETEDEITSLMLKATGTLVDYLKRRLGRG